MANLKDQFDGLDLKDPINAPLSAAEEASVQLAQNTTDFINKVGFDENKKIRKATFGYEKKVHNEDGTESTQEIKIEAPHLSIVTIPNLQVDDVNVNFDMEANESSEGKLINFNNMNNTDKSK